MSIVVKFILTAVVAYLLGSINTTIIVSKAMLGVDIRTQGSGNPGLTNAFRVMGAKKTLIVLIGDVLKGVLAVLFAVWLFKNETPVLYQYGKLIGCIFASVGHIFPLYFGFKGGKGILTTAAGIAVFDWRILVWVFGVFLIFVIISRYISLGSVAAAFNFPIATAVLQKNLGMTLIALVIAALVIYMHRGNIKRLLEGTERKFSFHKKAEEEKK